MGYGTMQKSSADCTQCHDEREPCQPCTHLDREQSTTARRTNPSTRSTSAETLYNPTEHSPLLRKVSSQDAAAALAARTSNPTEAAQEALEASGQGHLGALAEAKIIASYSLPLIATFLLQWGIGISSTIIVGRLGKVELAAIALASTTAGTTCFTIVQGLATSLDTLCAQSYGSGEKHLIGVYCQRMALFLHIVCIPIAVLWWFSAPLLALVVNDAEIVRLATLYLRISILAIPGFILVEVGKRFLQVQGLFRATTAVQLVTTPCHILVLYFLVERYGFVGGPIAVVISRTLSVVLQLLYVQFIGGSQCWGGFTRRAFGNWRIMIKLAIPDMIMVEAEWLAFEIMTIFAGRMGTDYLAAQSVLTAVFTACFQVPFPLSIAASTRVGNLIGGGRVKAAKSASKVAVAASGIIGCLTLPIIMLLRHQIPRIFTEDTAIITIAIQILPFVAITVLIDGLCVAAHGILRGIGRQTIGGPINLIAHYGVSIPLSAFLAFKLDWKLQGLYTGLGLGLLLASIAEFVYLLCVDWDKTASEAEARNAAG